MPIAPCNSRLTTCLAYLRGNRFAALSGAGLAHRSSDLLEVRSMKVRSPTGTRNFVARFVLRVMISAAFGAGETVVHGAMVPHTPFTFQDTVLQHATGGGSSEPAAFAPDADNAGATTVFVGPGWG